MITKKDERKEVMKIIKTTTPPEQKSEEPVKEDQPKAQNKLLKKVVMIVGAVVLVCVVIIIIFGVGVYYFNWQNKMADKIVHLIPYPASIVNTTIVRYAEYRDDIKTLNHFYSAEEVTSQNLPRPTDDQMRKSVLSRMVRDALVSEKAQSYSVSVSAQEADQEFEKIVSQAGSLEEVQRTLRTLYNWDASRFKQKVLVPFLLLQKVQEKIAYDANLNSEAKRKADEALAAIRDGRKTFEEAVKEYSEDTTAGTDGDLGFFSKGEMVPEFENAVLNLKPGDVSDVVQTQYGFHIIELVEKTEATQDSPEQFHAKHILLKAKDIDQWVREELSKTRVIVTVSGYRWEKACSQVLRKGESCTEGSNNVFPDVGQ